MKRIFWPIIVLVFLIAGLFGWWFFYGKNSGNKQLAREVLPADAALLFSTRHLGASWDSLQQRPIWQTLNKLPGLQRMQQVVAQADEIGILNQLNGREVLFSLHPTERFRFDWLFVLPIENASDYSAFNEWRKKLSAENSQINKRLYRSAELYQIQLSKGADPFTLFVKNGLLVGSFTPYLVEEVARRMDGERSSNKLPAANKASIAANNLAGNLEVFWKNLPELFTLFIKEPGDIQNIFPALPYVSQLDVLLGEDGTLFTGFTQRNNTDASTDFLWALHNQQAQAMSLGRYVPQQAATLMFLGLSDPASWHANLQKYWAVHNTEQEGLWKVISEANGTDSLILNLDNEIGLATMPGLGKGPTGRLLYLKAKNKQIAQNSVKYLAQSFASTAKRDSAYQETFRGYTITELENKQLPQALFGGAFWGFAESYCVIVDDFIVIGNSIQVLKDMILDGVAEETWQRSLSLNKFLNRLESEHNYGLYIQASQFWPILLNSMAPAWQDFWKGQPALKQFDLLSAQLSTSPEGFYTNIYLHQQLRTYQAFEEVRLSKTGHTKLSDPIVAATEIKGSPQLIMAQASNSYVHIIDKDKKIIASDSLEGRWLGEVAVMPAQNNRSANYLLATDSMLYLYNENLERVSPFPIALPNSAEVKQIALLDYSGSGFYRILASDKGGNMFMYDLDGINLDGWKPLLGGGLLTCGPKHIRLRNKDLIYSFTQKGKAMVVNRRGEPYPKFPYDFADSLLGPVLLRAGSDFASTRLITVTANGWLVEINLNGELLQRKQLYRPDPRARFYIIPDQYNQTFLIAQQDRYNLRVLDAAGRELFEKDYLGASTLEVAYYKAGSELGYVVVQDTNQEFAYIYNLKGTLLQDRPINSSVLPTLKISAGKDSVNMFKAYGNSLEWYQFLK